MRSGRRPIPGWASGRHLASPAVDLDTHIRDVVGVLEMEDLRDIVLIGHSYGGMVATGVADRARERIAQLVYLDAFVPQDGQSLFDLQPAAARDQMRELARTSGEGWRLPPNPMPPDTAEADVAWATPRRFRNRSRLSSRPCVSRETCRRRRAATSIAGAAGRTTCFGNFCCSAQRESGWRHFELDASHNPHITAPQALLELLQEIAATGSA